VHQAATRDQRVKLIRRQEGKGKQESIDLVFSVNSVDFLFFIILSHVYHFPFCNHLIYNAILQRLLARHEIIPFRKAESRGITCFKPRFSMSIYHLRRQVINPCEVSYGETLTWTRSSFITLILLFFIRPQRTPLTITLFSHSISTVP